MEIIIIVLVTILLILIALFFLCGHIVFKTVFVRDKNDYRFAELERKEDKETPTRSWFAKQKLENYSIKSKDGLKLDGFLLNNNSNKIALIVHGYRGRYYSSSGQAKIFSSLGYDVFLINNRSHDSSDGKYFSMGYFEKEDLKLWIKFLLSKNPNYQIIILGVSMGAHISLISLDDELNNCRNIKAVIADCGYASLKEQIKFVMNKKFKKWVTNILSFIVEIYAFLIHHFRFTSTINLKNNNVPILFISGDKDDYVDVKNTIHNKDINHSYCEIELFKNKNHNQSINDYELYEKCIVRFLKNINYEN